MHPRDKFAQRRNVVSLQGGIYGSPHPTNPVVLSRTVSSFFFLYFVTNPPHISANRAKKGFTDGHNDPLGFRSRPTRTDLPVPCCSRLRARAATKEKTSPSRDALVPERVPSFTKPPQHLTDTHTHTHSRRGRREKTGQGTNRGYHSLDNIAESP